MSSLFNRCLLLHESVDSSRRIEGNQDAFNSTFPDRGTDSDHHSDRPFQSLLISAAKLQRAGLVLSMPA
jgi:hypothetical protein